jgi:mono/diheme cytochrome c family protein
MGPKLKTNLNIFGVVLGTLGLYTLVANSIPQIQSEVPEELSFTGEVSPEQLIGAGEELYNGAGSCTSCHGLGTRAPNLLTDHAGEGAIGQRCGTRVPGEDCKAYLHAAMVNPGAFVVSGFQPIMPDMSKTLSNAQIWALVAFLESQGGEVTVTGEDIASGETAAPAGGAAGGAAAGGAAGAAGGMDPVAMIEGNMCINCHQMDGKGTPLGPSFDGIGGRVNADFIRRAIIDPNAEASPGFEQFKGVMPATFGATFSAAQLEALVQFLAARK